MKKINSLILSMILSLLFVGQAFASQSSIDVDIEYKILDKGEFGVNIKNISEDAPLPTDSYQAIKGPAKSKFGPISFKYEGNYQYEISRKNIKIDPDKIIDTYFIDISVIRDKDGLLSYIMTARIKDASGKSASIDFGKGKEDKPNEADDPKKPDNKPKDKDDDKTPPSNDKHKGKKDPRENTPPKKTSTNVKTGVGSSIKWIIILLVAGLAFIFLGKKKKKK